MRAVVYDRYGTPDVLRLAEVERPVPKEDEVLVKIQATTVTRGDCAIRGANRRSGLAMTLMSRLIFGLRRPRWRILGSELAGEVEAVGSAVSEFAAVLEHRDVSTCDSEWSPELVRERVDQFKGDLFEEIAIGGR
jgi:NADPH:quinone reductase-like Zn-dependent oxidoreductase